MSRVAIVGSRGNLDAHGDPVDDEGRARRLAVRRFVADLPCGTVVVSGGAYGVDTWAKEAACEWGLLYDGYPADWKKLGKRAGFIRNATIVENCDRVVAFWDGKSRGTADTIAKAKAAGKPVEIR